MDKATIARQLEQARKDLSRGLDGLAWEANFPRKIKAGIKRKPTVWIGAAAGFGLVFALLIGGRRKRRPVVNIEAPARKIDAKAAWYAGLPLAIARLLLPVVQPLALEWLRKAGPGFVRRQAEARSTKRV